MSAVTLKQTNRDSVETPNENDVSIFFETNSLYYKDSLGNVYKIDNTFKFYSASVTQNGTSNPVFRELQNTIDVINTIDIVRIGIGTCVIRVVGLIATVDSFPLDYTVFVANGSLLDGITSVKVVPDMVNSLPDELTFRVYDDTNSLTDNYKIMLRIEKYPIPII